MYRSCFTKTWRVQTRHSRLGLIAVAISPLFASLALYLAQVCVSWRNAGGPWNGYTSGGWWVVGGTTPWYPEDSTRHPFVQGVDR